MRISDWSSDVCSSDLAGVPPDCSIADCQGRIRNPGTRLLERRGMNQAAMDMQQLFIADIGGGAGDPLEPGIRSQAVEASQETLIQRGFRQCNTRGRCLHRFETYRLKDSLLP